MRPNPISLVPRLVVVQPAADLSMEPALAESWDISDDGLIYTFNLRTDIPWVKHNPVTGETAAWQFARPGHHCGCPAALRGVYSTIAEIIKSLIRW